jgi:hypothetical protein
MMKVMVRYFARDNQKVALILLVFVCSGYAGTNTIVILKAKTLWSFLCNLIVMMQMRILHRDGTPSRYRKILSVKQLMRKIQKHWKVKMDHRKEKITNVIATIVLLT